MVSRVEVIGPEEFSAREWLRRDVLWASLMVPYGDQLAGWVDQDVTQQQQHSGNVSRQKVYSEYPDAELQSLGFFNQGKNVTGLISSAALFRACMERSGDEQVVNILGIQAKSVDMALDFRDKTPLISDDTRAYAECARLLNINASIPSGTYGINHRLIRAAKIMTGLASVEALSWVKAAEAKDGLPSLTINNGGHPRSAGPRVEKLKPIFNRIISSDNYLSLG